MTERLYYQDSLLSVFCATVLSCGPASGGYAAILDKTAFYPEGGGQSADCGTLGEANVADVRENNGIITHYIDAPLKVGEKIEGRLDMARRFGLMQLHTGEHIVSGLVNARFGYENVGFHMNGGITTIDFNGLFEDGELEQIELEANRAVYRDIPVSAVIYPNEQAMQKKFRSKKALTGDVRLVTIEGIDVCACCGTHLKSTGSVGLIKFLSAQKHRGGTRIVLTCGESAYKDYAKKHADNATISALLSSKQNDTARAVETLMAECERLKLENNILKTERLKKTAEKYQSARRVIAFEDGLSPDETRELALMLAKKSEEYAAAISLNAQNGRYAIASASGFDTRAVCKKVNQTLEGKGGGKPELTQGSFACRNAEQIKQTLRAGEENGE